MMKEVEVGDEFTGKVVKTTTFGAFVELAKGTDGLLHISNVSPGNRVDTVEDVLNHGDEIAGQAWSRSTASAAASACASPRTPTIAGKSNEELAAVVASGGDRGGGGGRAARDRGERNGAAVATARGSRPPAPPSRRQRPGPRLIRAPDAPT